VLGYQFKLTFTDCAVGSRPKRNFTVLDDHVELRVGVDVEGAVRSPLSHIRVIACVRSIDDVKVRVLHVRERALFGGARAEMFHLQVGIVSAHGCDDTPTRVLSLAAHDVCGFCHQLTHFHQS
jgi:hypothetical protein